MDARPQILAWAKWGLAHKNQIHYAQIRPMPLTSKLPMTTDCSGFVTLCYYLADAPDPNGLRYSHYGYTGTLLSHAQAGKRFVSRDRVLHGGVVVYGSGTGEHTAIVVETFPNGDVLTISHGSEVDPSYVWCGTPKGPNRGYPADVRTPVRYINFITKKVHPVKRVLNKIVATLAPKKAPPQGYQRPLEAPVSPANPPAVPSPTPKP